MVYKRIMCFKNHFLASMIFAIGTIIQTSLHLALILYCFCLRYCTISPSGAPEIFFYLTYFYDSSCAHLTLESNDKLNLILPTSLRLNQTELENIVQEILTRAVLPETTNAAPKISTYILYFIIFDGIWAISAIALLMGVCFRIKETCTLVFYGAWIIATALVSILDIVATVDFTNDIFQTLTMAEWMKFVGIKNIDDLLDLDSGTLLSVTPTLVVLSFTTKCIILWIINVVGIYCVLRATILAYQQSYRQEQKRFYFKHREARKRVDLDTAAARIRNWQLFYGGIDVNNDSKSSLSLSSIENKDSNSNPQQTEESQICSDLPLTPTTPTYFCYPTVDSLINSQITTTSSHDCMDELKSQKPWSYVQSCNDVLKVKFQNIDETESEIETKF